MAQRPEFTPPSERCRGDLPFGPRRAPEKPEHTSKPPRPADEIPARPSGDMPARPSPFARPLPGSRQPLGEVVPDSVEEKPEETPPHRPTERPMMPPVRDR